MTVTYLHHKSIFSLSTNQTKGQIIFILLLIFLLHHHVLLYHLKAVHYLFLHCRLVIPLCQLEEFHHSCLVCHSCP